MKILLDTQIFLWAITNDPKLSGPQRDAYTDENNDLYLSVVSIWEILVKVGIGKLPLPLPAATYVAKQLERNRIKTLGIHPPHLAELEKLPPLHKDPFDRMVLAQAKADKMALMSSDPVMAKYGAEVL